MSTLQWLITLPLVALAVLIVFQFLAKSTPVDRDEDGAESEREAEHIMDASRPAPLEETPRPHVRAVK